MPLESLLNKALFGAVRSGDAVLLTQLLKDRENLYAKDDLWKSLFDYAVSGQHGNCIITLMDAGFDPNFHPIQGGLSPKRPSALGEFYRTRGMFGKDVQNAVERAEKRFLLHRYFSRHRSTEDIMDLIDKMDKADIDLQDAYGRTALLRAVILLDIPVIKKLLDAGADPDIPPDDDDKLTPLALVCERQGRLALHHLQPDASERQKCKRDAIVELLVSYGASVEVAYPRSGETVLERIIWNDEAHPSAKNSYVKKFNELRENRVVERFREGYQRAPQIPIPKRKL